MGEENSRAGGDRPPWQQRSKIYKSLADQDSKTVDFLCKCWNSKPAEPLDGRGDTLLHLLVICQNVKALEELMKVRDSDGTEEHLTQEHLKKQNLRGETALHEAARHDDVCIVDLLLRKEAELISKIGCSTALYLAASSGKWKIFEKILKYSNDCMTRRKDGCTVLHAAIMGEHYSTAAKILKLKPELAYICNKVGDTALNLLASSPSSFRSNSNYTTATMGKTSFIPLQSLRVLFYNCIPHIYTIDSVKKGDEEDPDSRWETYIKKEERYQVVDLFLGLPWIQPIDDTKQQNLVAVALVRQLLEKEEDWSRYTYSAHKYHDQSETSDKAKLNPLIQAIEMGIPELVEEILRYFPDAANSIDIDGRNVFHYAAEHRSGDIYEMLKKYAINKDRMLLDVDNKGNTILHHATKTKPATNFSLGVANLMAWDIFWFQRIRHDCSPHLLHIRNNDGNTAEDLLLKDYKNKRQAAEKAVKEMNQGLMVVAALIATVSFAAVFTLPGGFDQNKGNPLFFNREGHHHDLNLFLSYVGLTFFASLIALGTLLSTQLSRFHLEDMYFALPLKYSIAISCLFLSSCSIFTTFLQALVLEQYMPPYYFTSLIIGCTIMGLVYVDSIYDVLTYIVEVLRHSRTYRSNEQL
ncbi:hypothetical protein DCAR_0100736 [Daucus carota subsp. sativus]|uniref:PGG domain-containing protein n=1 Tax=Daucus carota subsp. sativus TaxID=79200 RepID=A0AAF1AIR6_DAUCS|nr:hypothetical protein DCAR_0100736 [Daucus carota subsp. sativus]